MAVATYKLQVDWNDNGTSWTDTGEDIDMGRVRGINCFRGRDRASQLTGLSIGGRFSAQVDNRSGDYNSFNSSSPIAGNIVPGKPVRLLATSASQSDQVIWQGHLSRVRPRPISGGDNVVRLEGHGPLSQINVHTMSLAMRTSETTNVTIGAILDEIGWPTGLRTLGTGQTTITRYTADRKFPVTAIRELAAAENGFIWEGNDGKINFDNRHARLVGAALVSQATFSDASGAARPYKAIEQLDPLDSLFNIFSAAVTIFSVASIATLWTLTQVGTASVAIAPGESFTWWSSYPTPGTATDGAWGVDAWTTPAATTDYTFNSAAGGGGTNITGSMGLAATKFGNAMKLVFTNNHASLTAYVQTLQARGTAITSGDPITIREEDTTSQTTYNTEREWPAKTEYIPTTQEAYDWAKFNLSIYKDPIPMLRMTIDANRDQNMLDEMIDREIGDRVTVVAQNTADLDINRDFFVEAIEHDIRSDRYHQVRYLLSDAEQFSDWWVWGTSKWGTTTRWAY